MTAENTALTLDGVKEYVRDLQSRESTSERVNNAKKEPAYSRAERRLLRAMFTLLLEDRIAPSKESAVRLVCNDYEPFLLLERELQYREAGKMMERLRAHISPKETPLTVEALIRLDEYPERLQQKAMIMAIHDLTDN